jgi:guanine nucleotide-binding protein subunit alpha
VDFWDLTSITLKGFVTLIRVDRSIGPKEPLPLQYLQAFKSLWADEGLQRVVKKGNEFALQENIT